MAPLPNEQASQSTAERVAKWAQDNAIVLTLGAGAVAVGGYWLMTSTSTKDIKDLKKKASTDDSLDKKAEGSSKKSKSKKKKSSKNESEAGGALLDDAPICK